MYDFLLFVTDNRWVLLAAIVFVGVIVLGLCTKITKKAIKWTIIVLAVVVTLIACGFVTSKEVQEFFLKILSGIANFDFEETVLNSPT